MRKDFCLCFNDAYVPYASVTIQSIWQHTVGEVHIHVLTDYLSEQNIQFLKRWNVEIYMVEDDKIFDGIDVSVWSKYTLYRLFLPNYLDKGIRKILYLDCDVIVNGSLDELFNLDMSDMAVGGCIDTLTYSDEVFTRLGYDYSDGYICAGVLLMNLDYWRNANLSTRIINYMKSNPDKIAFLEQDALNLLCCNNKIILPARYGVQVPFFRNDKFIEEHIDELEELIERPTIVHFAGYQPWIYCKNKSLHSRLWWDTYKSLKAFPQVKVDYVKSIVKYLGRYILSKLHLIGEYNKYHINQYYKAQGGLSVADGRRCLTKELDMIAC